MGCPHRIFQSLYQKIYIQIESLSLVISSCIDPYVVPRASIGARSLDCEISLVQGVVWPGQDHLPVFAVTDYIGSEAGRRRLPWRRRLRCACFAMVKVGPVGLAYPLSDTAKVLLAGSSALLRIQTDTAGSRPVPCPIL